MGERSPRDEGRVWNSKLKAHRGLATWGERLVPLQEFRAAVAATGRTLDAEARALALRKFTRASDDGVAVEGPWTRIAVFGGVYSNRFALSALLEDARARGAEAIYCLGDLGGFGPSPEKIWSMLEQGRVLAIQGNYEQSLSSGAEDCNCGYTDPRDNHFADLSYRYTERNCSGAFKHWMGTLPSRRRVLVGERELLLVHGSPRRVNEFMFESTTPVPYLELLVRQERCDGVLCTHTGLHWHRRLPSGADVVNVGVIGRPANDGSTRVRYALIEVAASDRAGGISVEFVSLSYDHASLAQEMRREELPAEFIETIETGWWTTCLEILPARERFVSKF